jgi:UDP-GlcNAc:undecaprenyl-phosphate GlcNAc-1-phosphate transferase
LGVSAQDLHRATATLILAAVSGAVLGFLRYNFHPSRIIMGDAGAYFLGFVLATTSIFGRSLIISPNDFASVIPAILFLLVPILDTTQVIIKRLSVGKNPLSTPGKDHLHHRLMFLGFSQRNTALILWGITFTANVIAMHLKKTPTLAIAAAFLGIIITLSLTVGLRLFALQQKKIISNK